MPKSNMREQFISKMSELVLEYADEAEHQDGYEYWDDHFKHVDEAVKDFVIYLQNRD